MPKVNGPHFGRNFIISLTKLQTAETKTIVPVNILNVSSFTTACLPFLIVCLVAFNVSDTFREVKMRISTDI